MGTSIEEELAKIEALVTGKDKPRDFATAHRVAREVTISYPEDPRGWQQYVLLCNLTGRHDDALQAQHQARQKCGSHWTEQDDGDCHRDHALYHLHRQIPDAQRHLRLARRYHANNPNRMAALLMVEARLNYARKDYDAAIRWFIAASEAWAQLRQRIDQGEEALSPPIPQWEFNCDRWHLKAVVALRGLGHTDAKTLWASLQRRMLQYGSPDIRARLTLVMRFGRLGNRLDDVVETPQGRQFIRRHPKLEALAQRLLTTR